MIPTHNDTHRAPDPPTAPPPPDRSRHGGDVIGGA